MTTTCATGCGEPTRDVLLLCSTCSWRLECDLGDVGAEMQRADVTLSRRAVLGAQNDGGRPAEKPLPIHLGMYEAKLMLEVQLVGWVRDLAERHGEEDALPGPALHQMAGWLQARMYRLATHSAAGDIHAEITSSMAHIRRLNDRPAEREFVGICDIDGCPGWLYAYDGATTVTCRECDAQHPVADSRERLQDKLADRLMTVREIVGFATHYGIERKRASKLLGSWIERGQLVPSSTVEGESLFPFGSTLKRLRDTPTRVRRAS